MLKLNYNKNIGQVIYIVEGEKTEVELLQHIFTKILNYNYTTITRGQNSLERYQSKTNPNSRIFVINTLNPQISSIKSGKEYLDMLFKTIHNQYNLDVTRAAVYYIFDRDPKSNPSNIVCELIGDLKNSRDNDDEMGGLLLISYPAIEAYLFECFINNCYSFPITNAKIAKRQVIKFDCKTEKLTAENLLSAAKEMLKSIFHLSSNQFRIEEIDNFAARNKEIFDYQEDNLLSVDRYILLSLLSISFIDLGIIEFEQELF